MFNFLKKFDKYLASYNESEAYSVNLALNNALLSNDPIAIKYFYQYILPKFTVNSNIRNVLNSNNSFFAHVEAGNAFCYFGIVPQIVEAKTNIVTNGGFKFNSNSEEDNNALQQLSEHLDLQTLWSRAVYIESGLGDVLFRTYNDEGELDIKIYDPFEFNIYYKFGKIKSIAIRHKPNVEADILDSDSNELWEMHYLNNEGKECIDYLFSRSGVPEVIDEYNIVEIAQLYPDFNYLGETVFEWKGFKSVVYKQNASTQNNLYKHERGVSDIQGLWSVEEALSETISDCIDAVRKAGIKEFVDSSILEQDVDGKIQGFDPFNKRFVYTKGSVTPTNAPLMHQISQGKIEWQSYTEIIRLLIATALNKAGLSPSSIGITGIESINSSSDAQENREKTSIRTRERALTGWRRTLEELINNYLIILDYINGRAIKDYKKRIVIKFPDMATPNARDLVDLLSAQLANGIKSRREAIKEMNPEFNDSDAKVALQEIDAEQQAMQQQAQQMELQAQGQAQQQAQAIDLQGAQAMRLAQQPDIQ